MATSGIHDRRTGRIGATGKNGPLGSTYNMYNNALEFEKFEYIPDEVDDVDDFVEDLISKKVHGDGNTSIKLEPQRSDMNSLTTGYRNEGTHTTTARSTISPFSNKQLYPNGTGPIIGTGGSDQAFHTTGNQMFTGSEKGWVGPHKLLTDTEDEHTLYKINECLRDN